jgi:CRISPR-associated protein Cas5t
MNMAEENINSGYFLRLRLYQPQAHFRIPFTYQRRHTYPIPPYSTVIGFLSNLLGYEGLPVEYDNLKKIKISIGGRFKGKTTEYIWFRNVGKEAHIGRFSTLDNRSLGGHVEHIGGQSPVFIDVLNDVHLVIYLAHKNKHFLQEIRSSLENPIHRLEILHLGRAEDWIVVEELSPVIEVEQLSIKRVDANFRHFFWIPEKMYSFKSNHRQTDFDQFEGLSYKLPTFWNIEKYKETLNRHGRRIFDHIKVKLSDGLLTKKYFCFDEEFQLPVFLADFEEKT